MIIRLNGEVPTGRVEKFPLADMTEAAGKKTFHAALGAGDALLQGLRADLQTLLLMTDARDELVEGSPPGRDRLKL